MQFYGDFRNGKLKISLLFLVFISFWPRIFSSSILNYSNYKSISMEGECQNSFKTLLNIPKIIYVIFIRINLKYCFQHYLSYIVNQICVSFNHNQMNICELISVCSCPRNVWVFSDTTYDSQTKLIGQSLHASEHAIGYLNLTFAANKGQKGPIFSFKPSKGLDGLEVQTFSINVKSF